MIIQAGTSLNIKMDGGCSGTCTSAGQNLSIQQPVLKFMGMSWVRPAIKAPGKQTTFTFSNTGTYKVVAKQLCSDGSECETSAVIEVRKKKKPQGAGKLVSVIAGTTDKCGNSPCMHPYYYSDQNQLLVSGNEIVYDKPGLYKIGYVSECFPQCSADKDVTWQITDPDGNQEVKSAQNLFKISKEFRISGVYDICIIESAKCPGGDRQDSKFLVIKVE